MADTKISDLTAATDLSGAVVPIVQGGANKRAAASLFHVAGGTDVPLADGGTGASLSDPGADRIMAWDDSGGTVAFIALADITTEAAPATGDYVLAYTAEGALVKVDWSGLPGAGSGDVSKVGTPADNQVGV
jgi:hypothetical protein